MRPIAVGLNAVAEGVLGVEHEAEAPVHDDLEGVVPHAHSLVGAHRIDRLRLQQADALALASACQSFEDPDQIACGTDTAAAGPWAGIARADGEPVGPHGIENRLAGVLIEGPAVDEPYEFSEDDVAAVAVVTGLPAWDPARFEGRGADGRDDSGPPLAAMTVDGGAGGADPARVRQQVADGDSALAIGTEGGNVVGHPLVEIELAPLPLLRHRDGRDDLGCGQPRHRRVDGHSNARRSIAPHPVDHRVPVRYHSELRAGM